MIKVLAVFATLILGGVALLTGGCSLVFSLDVFSGTFGDFLIVWLGGFAVAAVAIWLIRLMWRAVNRAEARAALPATSPGLAPGPAPEPTSGPTSGPGDKS